MAQTKHDRYVKLSWELLGYKLAYYFPFSIRKEYRAELFIPNIVYDELEREYLMLCIELREENTVCHTEYPDIKEVRGNGMIKLDFKRDSVETLIKKFSKKGWFDGKR